MALTLDAGTLIALERRSRRAISVVEAAKHEGGAVTVPVAVVVEWWRGQRGPAAHLLDAFVVEPLTWDIAAAAGEALGRVTTGPSVVDAVVMASASRRGDTVLTSDRDDLERLRQEFPTVRVLGVGD